MSPVAAQARLIRLRNLVFTYLASRACVGRQLRYLKARQSGCLRSALLTLAWPKTRCCMFVYNFGGVLSRVGARGRGGGEVYCRGPWGVVDYLWGCRCTWRGLGGYGGREGLKGHGEYIRRLRGGGRPARYVHRTTRGRGPDEHLGR